MGSIVGTFIKIYMFVFLSLCWCTPPILNPDVLMQLKDLGDCQACKLFVDSFTKGLERTARGQYEGGDTAWEEEKLKKSYKYSELRLLDIQDGVCTDVVKHSVQCHHMADKAEEFIEEWWAQKPDESADLYTYMCIEKMKFCCPAFHYGKNCIPCPGDHNNLCNGHGKCRGDGTRKGNGTCVCDAGYDGENCDRCLATYYLSSENDETLECSPCHSSCFRECRSGSQKECLVCKPGYFFDSEEGCLDIDECESKNTCHPGLACINLLGSYACIECDQSCDGCFGEGPDMCIKCANGYSMDEEFCILDVVPDDEMTSTRNEEL